MNKATSAKVGQQVQAQGDIEVGVREAGRLSVTVMSGISALVGTWAVVTLISAMVDMGGPASLVRGWLNAVTGM